MKWFFPALVLFLGLSNLYGSDETAWYSRAERLFEAGRWHEAQEALKEGEGILLNSDQRSIVLYNRAVVLLADGQWRQALALLEEPYLGSNPSPLLAYRWHTVRALAALREAESSEARSRTAKDPVEGLTACRDAKHLCDMAWSAWQESQQAASHLAELEGSEEVGDESTLSLHDAIKEGHARLRSLEVSLQLAVAPLPELTSQLEHSLEATVSLLEQYGVCIPEATSKSALLSKLVLKLHHTRPMWVALCSRLSIAREDAEHEAEQQSGDPIEEPTRVSAVAQAIYASSAAEMAHQRFLCGLAELVQGEIWKSRTAQVQSLIALRLLKAIDQGMDPLDQLLERRLFVKGRIGQVKEESLVRALEQEFGDLCDVAVSLTEALAEEQDLLGQKLLERLSSRLLSPEEEADVRHDLLYYRQLASSEERVLLTLLDRAATKENSQHFEQIAILEERFEIRKELGEQVDRVVEELEKARRKVQHRMDWKGVEDHLERALREWAPLAWLEYCLEGVREQAQGAPSFDLLDLHRSMKQVASEQGEEELFKLLDRSAGDVECGIMQLGNDHRGCSAVCMCDCRFVLDRASRELAVARGKETPSEGSSLEWAVALQEHALSLVERCQKASESETLFEPVLRIPQCGQEEVLSEAMEIPIEALEASQVKNFILGLEEVRLADKELQPRKPGWGRVAEHQRKAIEYWKEAQQSDPKKDSDGDGDGGEADQQENSSQDGVDVAPEDRNQEENKEESASESGGGGQGEENVSVEGTSTQQVFEWLEQMEREDASQEASGKRRVRYGVKPW